MRFSFSLIALGASLAAAIEFTSPTGNSTVVRGSEIDVTWNTVDTDPSTLSLYLVNFRNWPPYYAALDYDVNTASGSANVRIPCNVDATYGYQINAINGTNVYIIYAQSPEFSIGGATCTDPVDAASTCPPAPTVTVTVSGTLTLGPTVTKVYAGSCPTTIGWNGGYGNAVTLTKVPRADSPVITDAPAWGNWNQNQNNNNGGGGDSGDNVYITQTVTRVHTEYRDCPCEQYECTDE